MRRAGSALVVALFLAVFGCMAAAWLTGWRINVVESESMAPSLHRNSVALVAPVFAGDVTAGDVIEFRDATRGDRRVIHRVKRVLDHGQGRFFETKGDANDVADGWLVPENAVEGRLTWDMAHLGSVTRALAPPGGVVILVGVPLLLGLASELRRKTRPLDLCPSCGAHRGRPAASIQVSAVARRPHHPLRLRDWRRRQQRVPVTIAP